MPSLNYAPAPRSTPSPARMAIGCALLTCALLPAIASIRFHLRHSPMVVGIAIVGVPFLLACTIAGTLTLPPGRRRRTLLWFAAPLAASLGIIIYAAAVASMA